MNAKCFITVKWEMTAQKLRTWVYRPRTIFPSISYATSYYLTIHMEVLHGRYTLSLFFQSFTSKAFVQSQICLLFRSRTFHASAVVASVANCADIT